MQIVNVNRAKIMAARHPSNATIIGANTRSLMQSRCEFNDANQKLARTRYTNPTNHARSWSGSSLPTRDMGFGRPGCQQIYCSSLSVESFTISTPRLTRDTRVVSNSNCARLPARVAANITHQKTHVHETCACANVNMELK